MVDHGVAAFLTLGGVVLAVTGAEALYADRGHFGAHGRSVALVSPLDAARDPRNRFAAVGPAP